MQLQTVSNILMRIYPAFIFAIVTVFILNGCSEQTYSEKRVTFAEKEGGPIIFGAAWPFESSNELFWEGVELAVSEINDSGGVLDRPLEVVKKDDHSSVTKGLEIAQAFSENEQLTAVIGHRNSHVSIPVSSIYEKAGLVMLSPASSSPDLIKEENQFIFRNIISDTKLSEELANFAYKQGHENMVIIYDDNEYGEGLANAFERQAKDIGVDIVDRLSHYTDASHLAQLKYNWENLQYDGIFIGKSNPEGAQLIKDLRMMDIGVPIYGGNAMDSLDLTEIAGNYADGTVLGSLFNPVSHRKKVVDFMDNFYETYDEVPSQYSALGYDAVYLLVEAIIHANSTIPKRVAASMQTMDEWEGVVGVHHFGENGNDIGDLVVIKKLNNSRFEFIE